MDQLELLAPTQGDSVYNTLKTMPYAELSGKELIRWTLLFSQLADSLGKSIPSDTILERSVRYVRMNDKDNLKDNAYMNHYLGRSYAKSGKNEDALASYLYVIEMLEKAGDNSLSNLLGYTYSYAADLYLKEYDPKQARLFYRKAAFYFEKAANHRSEAIAYRDLAKCSSFEKDFNKALEYALIADSMAQYINEPILHASLATYLSGIYTNIGRYDAAEDKIRKAIDAFPQNSHYHYLTLTELYLRQARYQDANLLLDSISSLVSSPQRKLAVLNYRYKIERKLGNSDNALLLLEQERMIADSIRNQSQAQTLYEVEQKYAQEQLLNANNQLQIKYQQVVIVVIALILLLLIIFFLFRAKEHKREQNEFLLKQELSLKEQESEKQQLRLREQE
ncbi:MAG: tetratricopeptide repeat protein, partial [Bacteroidales bacterium]